MHTKLVLQRCVMMLGVALLGCEDDDPAHEHADGGSHVHSGDAAMHTDVRCSDDIPDFVTGLAATSESGELTARLVRAMPTPPRKRQNDWTIQLVDAAGDPVTNVDIIDACAFMPVHGHGASTQAVSAGSEPGEIQIDDFYFSMRGPWEVQLAVSSQGSAEPGVAPGTAHTDCDRNQQKPAQDLIVFDICVMDE